MKSENSILTNYLAKKEVILFIGPDILSQLNSKSILDGNAKLLTNLSDILKKDEIITSGLDFINIFEKVINKENRNFLISQMQDFFKLQKVDYKNYESLVNLFSTKQPLVVYYWFDDFLIKLFKASSIDFNLIINEDDIYYSEIKDTYLIYLFGIIDSPDSLKLSTQDIFNRFYSENTSRLKIYLSPQLAYYSVMFVGFSNNSFIQHYNHFQFLLNTNNSSHSKQNFAVVTETIDESTATSYKANLNLNFIKVENLNKFLNNISAKVSSIQNNFGHSEKSNSSKLLPNEPFKYLDYYCQDDKDIFLGRDANILSLKQKISQNRVLLLCGKSGVGKSSLIYAGLYPDYKKSGFLFCVSRVLPSPQEALLGALGLKLELSKFDTWVDIVSYKLEHSHYENAIIVFDQFEEFFTEFTDYIKKQFWQSVQTILDNPKIQIQIIFSFREEALPQFTSAFPHLPSPFGCVYFLESLNKEQTKTLINDIAKLYDLDWSHDFVEFLMDDLGNMNRETAHLSIVLTILWRKKVLGQPIKVTYQNLGGASGILKNYLWDEINHSENQSELKEVIKSFVSPERRKSQISLDDIKIEMEKKGFSFDNIYIEQMCNQLINLRLVRKIVGDINFYELSHDCLAEEIAKTVSDEDMNRKIAKRRIRELYQIWVLNKILPNRVEHKEFEEKAKLAGLTQDEKYLFILSSIHNGLISDEVEFSKTMSSNDNRSNFINLLVNCHSIEAFHYILTFIENNIMEPYSFEIISIIWNLENLKPSIIIHLNNVVAKLTKETRFNNNNNREISHIDRTILINTGKYNIGSIELKNRHERSSELPIQEVMLNSFEIDRFLVTNLEYKLFLEETNYNEYPVTWENSRIPKNLEYHPVTGVSWFDAAYYALWRSKRLPTEAEWLVAGYYNKKDNKLNEFPWGNKFIDENANYFERGFGRTTPIGSFHPDGDSQFGLCDIAGNAFEWLLDDNINPPQIFSNSIDPVFISKNQNKFKSKITRGGSYGGGKDQLSSRWRQYTRDENTNDVYIGFRCVQSNNIKLMDVLKNRLKSVGIIKT